MSLMPIVLDSAAPSAFIAKGFTKGLPTDPISWVAIVLVDIAVLMLHEGIGAFFQPSSQTPKETVIAH